MTSQTYQTDDNQLVQEHDQAVPENDMMEADADLAEPDADLAEPDADLAEPDADLAETDENLAEPDADLAVAEVPLAELDANLAEPEADRPEHEDDAAALAGHEWAAASLSDYPAFHADGADAAEEPVMADSSLGDTSLVSVDFTVSESVTASHPAGDTAHAAGPWNEVQAMFVDDPHASIERAAGLVGERVEALVESVRERQRSMQSAWQADDAGTEELRIALQHYRAFWNSLEDLPTRP